MDIPDQQKHTPERILCADDDPSTRRLLGLVLGRQGFSVVEARDGAQAVELFESERPALVLLDVFMPVMDGFQACKRIREIDREGTPVIMLTAADEIESIEHAFDVGATDFILKPINWTLLTQRVRYALRSGALLREVRQNRLRQASARRIARLVFWEWSLVDDTWSWTDDLMPVIGIPDLSLGDVTSLLDVTHEEDRGRLQRVLNLVRQGETQIEIEFRLQVGEQVRLVRMVGELCDEGGEISRMIGAFQNVTELRRTEALVDYLALHDELTDLGNRRLFVQQVGDCLSHLEESRVLWVGWIDIMRFHRHNDVLGEEAGDWLLARLARRLSALVAAPDAVARVGGDEFAVMFQAENIDAATRRFEGILQSMQQPFRLSGQESILTLSAGAACYPQHSADAKHLLVLAQDAQRLARTQGRTFVMAAVGNQNSERFAEALAVERALHTALDNGEFFLVYQPQMDLAEGRIVGVEALLRWRHPQRGVVSPAQFVPILENLGLISQVGQWILAEVCRQARQWQQEGLDLRLAVNLSPRQFLEADLQEQIESVVRESGVDPSCLELEITESLAMQDPVYAIDLLKSLRRSGFRIAIDDFGIGHSSLEYLMRFPVDAVKIDRAFVSGITSTRGARAVVRAVTVMGQAMQLGVIAEGVETLRQCDFVAALGVTEVQGYLIGRPQEAGAIATLVREFVPPGND